MGELMRTGFERHNRNLIAKAIEELTYEEILFPKNIGRAWFELELGKNAYKFKARFGAWGNLQVDPKTLTKNSQGPVLAREFFTDANPLLGMNHTNLAKFLEEAAQTLYSDELLERRASSLSVGAMAHMDQALIESFLPGHPKLILNKGRLGWGANEIREYAPESGRSFSLSWIAAHKSVLTGGGLENNRDLLSHSFSPRDLKGLIGKLESLCANPCEYVVLPVHPWQMERFIRAQYHEFFADGRLIDLEVGGNAYRPQASIRTLSNYSRPKCLDIKLGVSILNTSCVRGIPARHIKSGPRISDWLEKLVRKDRLLKNSNTQILKEVAGASIALPGMESVPGAPYRFNEMLGCVWRECVRAKSSKHVVPAAALFYRHPSGASLLKEYIGLSALSADKWFDLYFQKTVIPLYHLQLAYGVGLVAHGQNILLEMDGHRPSGMLIKDFHGDLRFGIHALKKGVELEEDVLRTIDVLPPEHLIHDLVTAYFVTTLRYVSRVADEDGLLSEREFYKALGACVEEYLDREGSKHIVCPQQDLRRKNFEKILVNKVRFVAGYKEGGERLKPLLGSDMPNPLFFDGGASE